MIILILSIIVFGLSIALSFYIKTRFKSSNELEGNITGGDLLNTIKSAYGLNDLEINAIPGELSDHFMPSSNQINLSEDVYYGSGIGSIAVALHEFGHALQHKEGSILTKIHSVLFFPMQIASTGGFLLFLLGTFLKSEGLMLLGIILFSIAVLYYLILSIVEFDASKRGYKLFLDNSNIIGIYGNIDEYKYKFKKMLFIAFMTYFLSLIQAVLQLVDLIIRYSIYKSED